MHRWTSNVINGILWAISLLLLFAVVYGSLNREPPLPIKFSDKVWHFLSYASLTTSFLLSAVWFPGRKTSGLPLRASYIVGFALALGVALEVLQVFTLTRVADLFDALMNALGVWAGFTIWSLLRQTLEPVRR
jgi:VanZ family protein